MARNFKRKEGLSALNELNITPLMDLAFSLLIIFMVTTPLLEQTIELNLPKQEQNSSNQRPDKVEFQVINIDARGQVYWGKQPVDLVELENMLAALAKELDPKPISLRADRTLQYQKVIDVIDAIKRHKLTKLNLDTEVK